MIYQERNCKAEYKREPLGDIILGAYVRDIKEDLSRFPDEFTPAIYARFIQRIIALWPNNDADATGVLCKVNPDPKPQDRHSALALAVAGD